MTTTRNTHQGSATRRGRGRVTAGRIVATGLAASVATVAASATAGSAEPAPGVGTATVSSTILDASLGRLLGLQLLEDSARSTTDPAVGTAGALAKLTSVRLSSTVAALNKTLGDYTVSSPGTPSSLTTSLLDLQTLGLDPLVKGTVEPVVLSSLHQPTSATATSAQITDLNLVSGLAGLGVLTSNDKTGSGGASAEADRTMGLDALTVLNLGRLLSGLGIDLLKLPISIVSGLVTSLGIPVDLQGATDLNTLVTSITNSIDALLASTSTTVTNTIGTTLGTLGLPVDLTPAVNTAVTTAVAALRSALSSLVDTVTTLLQGAPLLKVSALDLATVAKAGGDVASSVATATGKVGSLQVGSIVVPGIDVAATADAVNGLLAKVETALNGVLGPLGLTNLVTVRVFDKSTSITSAAGVITASSAITALAVKLTPPANLAAIVNGLNVGGGLGTLLPAQVAPAVDPLTAVLGGATSVLTDGLALNVGTVKSQSVHAVPAAVPANPSTPTVSAPTSLPRTGGEAAPLAFGALLLGGLAIGSRRVLRRAGSVTPDGGDA